MSFPGRSRFPEVGAARMLASHRPYLLAYAPAALITGLGYAYLQAWLSVGIPAWWTLEYLTPSQSAVSLGFALLFPWLILLDIYLWRHPVCLLPRGADDRRHGTTLVATLVGILPNLLCCTPIVPTLLAVFVSGGTLLSMSSPIQHAMSTFEIEFYAVSLVLLWVAIRLAARRLEAGTPSLAP